VSPFRFRLSRILRLRENLRDEHRQLLGAAQMTTDLIRDQIAALHHQIAESRRDNRTDARSLNIDRLLDADRFETNLVAQLHTAQEQHQLAEAEVDRHRQILIESDREVKTLEKLRQHQVMRHRLDDNRRQAKQLDTIAIERLSDSGV
jgi:flagellar protein FliJ